MESRDFTTEYKFWLNQEKMLKLEQAFQIGCNYREACAYAEITTTQLYYYQKEVNPNFLQIKEEWKEKPILKAKHHIVKGLDDADFALKYLERVRKNEFSLRTEHTGAEGRPIEIQAEVKEKINKALDSI